MKYKADPRIRKLINKQVPFKFFGEKLLFDLSMGLFSSYDIDAGSRLLLKTLAREAPLDRTVQVVDTGCGIGVLGLCLKKKFPGMELIVQDRDALAVEFTGHNAALNGISLEKTRCRSALLLEGIEADSQDLILCNIPAKAGDRVIRDFIRKSSSCIRKDGRVAVVIVDTLKETVARSLKDLDLEILYTESTRMHSVFHFSGVSGHCDIPFKRYIRHRGPFKMADDPDYELSTVYNLPDFDQLSFWLHVQGELLRHDSFGGRALFWNPGQGHLPVWLNSRKSNRFSRMDLASRDVLQCLTSAYNLEKSSFGGEVEKKYLPGEEWLVEEYGEGRFDCIFLNLNPIPRVKWHQDLAETAQALVKKGKYAFIMGRSSDMSQFEKYIYGFKTIRDDRFKGNRGILLKKN